MSVYAISDLHGRLDLYQKVKNFLKPEDKVYCLGDCGDRGPNSWETIKAVAADPQFIYMKGNHEDMLVNAMKEYLNEDFYGNSLLLLYYNGGVDTFDGWINDGQSSNWYHYLRKLPAYQEYKNKDNITIMLCHAGFTPGVKIPEDEDLIWNRDHIYDDPIDSKNICVHGHTPIQAMIKDCPNLVNSFKTLSNDYKDGAFWYCDGHKVNIDSGSYVTGKIILLDLDTFDEHIFTI